MMNMTDTTGTCDIKTLAALRADADFQALPAARQCRMTILWGESELCANQAERIRLMTVCTRSRNSTRRDAAKAEVDALRAHAQALAAAVKEARATLAAEATLVR